MTWTPKLRMLLIAVVIVVPLDQLTKLWVVQNIHPFDPWVIIPGFFQLTHARNPGMMLGLFREVPAFVLVGFILVALGILLYFFRQIPPDDRLSSLALGLVVAGALGNLLDRLTRGAVVDFLQFDLGWFVWPDFNVADSAIVIGTALLLLDMATFGAPESSSEDPPP